MKKIGILGGMGPQASLHFYEMLIKKTEKNFAETEIHNHDYPYILLANIPVPDVIEGQQSKNITIKMVHNEAKALEKAGADFLVMPCNTMHLFQDSIMEGVNIPFLSMIQSVVAVVEQSRIKKVGLLGSSTTMSSPLYTRHLKKSGITILTPPKTEHHDISNIIKKYISGKITLRDIQIIKNHCDLLIEKGAQGIILGCTELPLILKNNLGEYNFFISSEILANETLLYSQKS